jgi:hypothetical protein
MSKLFDVSITRLRKRVRSLKVLAVSKLIFVWSRPYVMVLDGCSTRNAHFIIETENGFGTRRELPAQHEVGRIACLMENKILIEICYLAH